MSGYLRLTDFGIARLKVEENYRENLGTLGYIAPEVAFNQNHGKEADYFAIGVMIHEMLF